MGETPIPARRLVVLPHGEAVRPEEVRRLLIEPAVVPPRLDGQRFRVVLELVDGEKRALATGLTQEEAADFVRRCARELASAASPS